MHSSKIQNKLTFVIFVCTVIGIAVLFWYKTFAKKPVEGLSSETAALELQQGLDSVKELEKNPFQKYLPYSKDGYTIVYSSIKKSIVVIFDADIDSISTGRASYENEITAYLRSIGVISGNINIKWDIVKEKNQ